MDSVATVSVPTQHGFWIEGYTEGEGEYYTPTKRYDKNPDGKWYQYEDKETIR